MRDKPIGEEGQKQVVDEGKSVAILGAGAVGAYFAKAFHERGFPTSLIAKGSRRVRMQNEGLVVNGVRYDLPIIDPEEADGPIDLIVVALKHHHLPAAVPGLGRLVGEDTVFISFMNGLDSEAYIGSIYGKEKVLYGVSVGIDAQRQGNRINFTKPGKHFFGEAHNDPPAERVQCIASAFERAGIAYENPPDMLRVLWWKFMVNVGMNQASAVMRAPYGVFRTSKDAQALMRSLMAEVIELAKPAGVNLTERDIEEWHRFLDTLAARGKTSMLQDIEAGRKTEVEIFGGKVVELGEKYGILTPVNRTMVQILRVLEEQD